MLTKKYRYPDTVVGVVEKWTCANIGSESYAYDNSSRI